MHLLSAPLALFGLSQLVAAISPSIPNGHWVDTWTSMPQLTETTNLPLPPFNATTSVFPDTTLRQTLHMSVGAQQIRIRISNAFGVNNLAVTAVTVALPVNGQPGVSAIDTTTLQKVTFGGNDSIIIPNGSLAVSDPLNFPVKAQSMITVTMFLANGQQGFSITSHPGSRTTSWFQFGNAVNAANLTITDPSTQSVAHWYFLSAVEGFVPKSTSSFVIVGDSITDGRGSDTDRNNRWPDLVLAKMQANAATRNIAVVNQAAGGNRILADGLGPNAIGRIDRDVLSHSGVKFAMIFEGVNDIGTANLDSVSLANTEAQLIQAFKQIVTRVHALGIPIFAATITPFSGPNVSTEVYPDPAGMREQTRVRVNNFIKTSGIFDAVVDFDAILRNPDNHTQLAPAFNSGDFLHPSVAGYQAVANAFPLDIFTRFRNGVTGFQ